MIEQTDSIRRFTIILKQKDEQTQSAPAELLVTRGKRFLKLGFFNKPVLIPIHHLIAPDHIRVGTRWKRIIHLLWLIIRVRTSSIIHLLWLTIRVTGTVTVPLRWTNMTRPKRDMRWGDWGVTRLVWTGWWSDMTRIE